MVSSEAFVKAWLESTSLAQVAEKVGLTRHQCSQRASNLRYRGVALRKFVHPNHHPLDVAALNAMVEAHTNG